jgi:hypothetical protein
MQKWEYLIVRVYVVGRDYTIFANFETVIKTEWESFSQELVAYLKSLGEQGWEMVTVQDSEYFFKRPID